MLNFNFDKFIIILILNFYFIFGYNPFKIINEVDFPSYNNTYHLLTSNEHHKEVDKIFNNEPFYTNFTFSINYIPKQIMTKIFNDLEYTAENGKRYGRSPYIIKKKKSFYQVEIPNYVTGKIQLTYTNYQINRYIYLVDGIFDTFVTLEGKMIVDVQYQKVKQKLYFNVKVFLILTSPLYWKLFKQLKKSPEFGKKFNKLIIANIRYIVKLGKVTANGIYRDSKGKFKF